MLTMIVMLGAGTMLVGCRVKERSSHLRELSWGTGGNGREERELDWKWGQANVCYQNVTSTLGSFLVSKSNLNQTHVTIVERKMKEMKEMINEMIHEMINDIIKEMKEEKV